MESSNSRSQAMAFSLFGVLVITLLVFVGIAVLAGMTLGD
jgi:hypothetical protein